MMKQNTEFFFMSLRTKILALQIVIVLAFFSARLPAQSEHPLTGRKIAPVMGIGGADWLERSDREIEEMPETALDAIGIRPSMVIADIGAGTGYFSIRMARRVGPGGKIYANDIQPEMLVKLKSRVAAAGLSNVEAVLGTESDPKLPAKAMDLILMVDVYHEFSQPQLMLRNLRRALKDDGALVLLEYRKEDPRVPIRPEHKMSVEDVKTELTPEGFKFDKVLEVLPRQHILIFRKAN
jgi:SAM-dependent methyltransferase